MFLTREQYLLPFLSNNPDKFVFVLPEIIYLEWAYYYRIHGHSMDVFLKDLLQLKAEIRCMDQIQLNKTVEIAYRTKQTFLFKIHARDYMIASV